MAVVPARAPLLVSLVLVGVLFAGCVGDDDPTPAESDPTPSAAASPSPTTTNTTGSKTERPLVNVDTDTAIFAPTWKTGMVWSYKVSGRLLPTEYETKIGVVDVEGDTYVMGAESVEELKNFAYFDGGIFLGGVQKDSLAVNHGDAYQDLLGFRRPVGEEWTATLFGAGFTLTKPEPSEVAHALGTARGLSLTGPNAKGGTVTIDYASDIRNIVRFAWVGDDGGIILQYELTAFAETGGTSGLKQWTVTSSTNADASGPPNNVGADTWDSDGSGNLVFLRVLIGEADAAGAVVTDPSGDVVAQVLAGGSSGGDVLWDGIVPDEQGAWAMALWHEKGIHPQGGSGTRSDVFLYQVTETAF